MSAASLDAVRTGRASAPAAYRNEDFPGCESFHLPASELDRYEYRLEFWDGATETAWKVCEPTSIEHEGPSRRLSPICRCLSPRHGSVSSRRSPNRACGSPAPGSLWNHAFAHGRSRPFTLRRAKRSSLYNCSSGKR